MRTTLRTTESRTTSAAADPTADVGTILGVWAHPDDEAYLSAGLMALARRHGRRVVVVTATAGERGTDDPISWPPVRLARRRRREMAASMAAIGVHEHRWLGYSDGACEEADESDAIATIGAIIDEVRPRTIVTFGPDGMTGHPDHRAVSAWATAAWEARRDHQPDAQLWYATLLPSFHEEWGDLNDSVGIFPPEVTAPETPEDDVAAVVRCEGWLARRKAAALRAHASQVRPLIDLVGDEVYDRWWSVEAFVDATRVLATSR
jgi:LmbE family N-acetylglucosaminyl deacetylase